MVGNGFYNINRERYRKLVIADGAPQDDPETPDPVHRWY